MLKEFTFVKEMVRCLCSMNINVTSYDADEIVKVLSDSFSQAVSEKYLRHAVLKNLEKIEPQCIYEFSYAEALKIAAFYSKKTKKFLIIGPCRELTLDEEKIKEYLGKRRLNDETAEKLLKFIKSLPPLQSGRFTGLCQLLCQKLESKFTPLNFKQTEILNSDYQPYDINSFDESQNIRRIENRYEASAALTEAVKAGNLSLAYRFIQGMTAVPDDLVRNPDSLRNAQNLCIILNTQLRYAMEETGVHPYMLDRVSGGLAKQIESLKTAEAAGAFCGEIIKSYCELASEKASKQLTPFARLAVSYIKSHLSDNLSVKEAAKQLLVNPDYLSYRFHKDVGISFIDFVNRERVNQAAALLKRTDLQIQQIAYSVGYNNLSYFAKQFKRTFGLSPAEYRKQSKL